MKLISVEDRYPNGGEYVLVFVNDITSEWVDMARPAFMDWIWERDGKIYAPIVTHWMPLPDPPEEK